MVSVGHLDVTWPVEAAPQIDSDVGEVSASDEAEKDTSVGDGEEKSEAVARVMATVTAAPAPAAVTPTPPRIPPLSKRGGRRIAWLMPGDGPQKFYQV